MADSQWTVVSGTTSTVTATPPAGLTVTAMTIIPPIHLYRQLKGAYCLSRFSALWRTFALLNITFVTAGLFGLLLLFVPSVVAAFQLSPGGVFLLGLVGVVGGAVTVVLQMRDAPPTDSGPDDGAVV